VTWRGDRPDDTIWCGNCQDHYPRRHHGNLGDHLAGDEYGWIGELLAEKRELREVVTKLVMENDKLHKIVEILNRRANEG
jgi:hypothetical protein